MSLTLKVVFFVPKEQKMLQNMLCPPKKTTTEYVVSSSPVAAVIRATEGEEGDCRATGSTKSCILHNRQLLISSSRAMVNLVF